MLHLLSVLCAPGSLVGPTASGKAHQLQAALDADAALLTSRAAYDKSNHSLLNVACASGNVEAMSVLLKAGANVNHQDMMGHTPLHHANLCKPCTQAIALRMVRSLILAGAVPVVKDFTREHATPADLARRRGWPDIVTALRTAQHRATSVAGGIETAASSATDGINNGTTTAAPSTEQPRVTDPLPLRTAFLSASDSGLAAIETAAAEYLARPIPTIHKPNYGLVKIFDELGPVHHCPAALHAQFGTGDAGKHTCGLDVMSAGHCVVLSLGSNNEWAFELAVAERTNCSIITLDCTCSDRCVVPLSIRSRARFFNLCVGTDTVARNEGASSRHHFKTWAEVLALTNQGRAPTLLKMDVEGAEWSVLSQLLTAGAAMQPHAISLELHMMERRDGQKQRKSHAEVRQLGYTLVQNGYALVRREDNPGCAGPAGTTFCSELVLARVLNLSQAAPALPPLQQQVSRSPSSSSLHVRFDSADAVRAVSGRMPGVVDHDQADHDQADLAPDMALRSRVIARCGRWCAELIARHNAITAAGEAGVAKAFTAAAQVGAGGAVTGAPQRSGYLEIDCETYSCGGWGNILAVVGQWALVAYLAGRAPVVRLPPSQAVSSWAASPFFISTAPPARAFPYTFAGRWIQTWILRRGDDAEQAERRVKQLIKAREVSALFSEPLVVVQADTISVAPALLRKNATLNQLRRDGFPTEWLAVEHIPQLLNFLLFQPTARLHAALVPYFRALGPLPYPAVHVRMGDASMSFHSAAHLHVFSYKRVDWDCVAAHAGGRRFFLAADTNATIAEAHTRFGVDGVVSTRGLATHLERDTEFYRGDAELAAKTFLDFFLLAHAKPPLVRNSLMTSFSVAAANWGHIWRAVHTNETEWQAKSSQAKPLTQCSGSGKDSWRAPPAHHGRDLLGQQQADSSSPSARLSTTTTRPPTTNATTSSGQQSAAEEVHKKVAVSLLQTASPVLEVCARQPLVQHADEYRARGFTILSSTLSEHEVESMAATIYGYIERNGALVRPYGLGDSGGWYVADFPREASLRPMLTAVDSKRALHRVLGCVLGEAYTLLSRNEFYVSRWAAWHMDTVWEPSAEPGWRPVYAAERTHAHLWDPLPNGEVYGIATVAIYLQDHTNDTQALTVRPGSHADKARAINKRELGKMPTQSLHPRKGDVLVFDSRLSHRGQLREFANFERVLRGRRQRMVLSFNYGKSNAFSESHRRSFEMRNELVLNQSLCHGAISGPCAQQAALHDVQRRPLLRNWQ